MSYNNTLKYKGYIGSVGFSETDQVFFGKVEGIEPRKFYSGTLNIRIAPQIHSKIAELATEAGVTINAFINLTLEREVESPSYVLNDIEAKYGSKRRN